MVVSTAGMELRVVELLLDATVLEASPTCLLGVVVFTMASYGRESE